MTDRSAGVVICGAGIAGLAAAWHLAVRRGVGRVVLVDERSPLTLTSDKSTECYRTFWPDAPMVALMSRSVEILDEIAAASGNAIALNRNGYLYLTGSREGVGALEASARSFESSGAGELRVRRGAASDPEFVLPLWDRPQATAEGADLFLDPDDLIRHFPWVTPDARAGLLVRSCGWISAQQLGMHWLERAREAGAELVEGRVTAVETAGGRVAAVEVARKGGTTKIATGRFVNAAGPFAPEVGRMVGLELPLFHELHRKVFFDDHLGAVPREAPLVIWNDPVTLDWSDEERAELAADQETALLAGEIPAGVHFRPEGGAGSRSAILLWNYHAEPVERRLPIPDDPLHVPTVVRGVARILPAFAPYAESGRKPYVDGGYYTKTRENRPLIGPAGPEGSFLLCALSGFGIMASPAAGELLAAHLLGEPLPEWQAAFRLERYDDPAYLAAIATADAGQL